MNESSDNFGMILLVIYLVVSQIASAYFLYIYIRSHSFIECVLFGPFVAEFKGILWPFFIF
jgi:hypothetical protein